MYQIENPDEPVGTEFDHESRTVVVAVGLQCEGVFGFQSLEAFHQTCLKNVVKGFIEANNAIIKYQYQSK
ncbi:MAG TPA: hypothetical protein EYN68_02700 [Candidatus Marinimicrobia bacterium]|nr:hypothetical protein [Candidatus Neomarinimicrobiota bacterium]